MKHRRPVKLFDRRAILAAGAVGAAGVWMWAPRPAPNLAFRPAPGVPGFRRVESGPITAGGDVLAGLDQGVDPIALDNLCRALFRGASAENRVRIASFSDYNCPFCKILTQKLAVMDSARVQVIWHELPLLGPTSQAAARGALAAAEQDAYLRFHRRLMRAQFVPTPAYLEAIGESLSLDTDRLLRDAAGEGATRHINTSLALAARLGILGTPALVIEDTIVIGEVNDRVLEYLIATALTRPRVC
jgi:protein-disulfide isomerase